MGKRRLMEVNGPARLCFICGRGTTPLPILHMQGSLLLLSCKKESTTLFRFSQLWRCFFFFFFSLDSPEGFAAGRPQQYLLFRPETVVRSGQLIGTLRLGQVRRCTTTWKSRPTLPVPKICMASFRNLTKVHHNSSVTGRPMARRRRVWGQCAHPAPGMGSRGSIKKIITYYSMVMLIDFTKLIGNDRLFSDSYC